MSWRIGSPSVEAWVTQTGGMTGPVKFDLGNRVIEPFSIAPWAEEGVAAEPVIQALRGDCFCMPFGHSPDPFQGEDHPLHGEAANADWSLDTLRPDSIDLVLECKVRPCKVYKTVRCGERTIYQRNTVIGLSGPMSYGSHAMLQFRSPGLISTSALDSCHVFPGQFEDPAKGGYSSLMPGANFESLRQAPLALGGATDLTAFPSREGYEDLVQVVAAGHDLLGWTAVTFPAEGFVFFHLKNRLQWPTTVFWFSNGGRHYAPWSGRHRGVLGIEETMSYFHLGLRGSVAPNPLQSQGVPTYKEFNSADPVELKLVQGVAEVPAGFDRVAHIVPAGSGIVLVSESGLKVQAPGDLYFLGV